VGIDDARAVPDQVIQRLRRGHHSLHAHGDSVTTPASRWPPHRQRRSPLDAPNNGQTTVWYARLSISPEQSRIASGLVPVAYEMRQEQLPEGFVETILSGWWTTCLEILPSKKRARAFLIQFSLWKAHASE